MSETKDVRVNPVPLYECEFKVGDCVHIITSDSGYDPDAEIYVLGVKWEHQSARTDFGWSITLSSADDIAKGYGASDGWKPGDLIRVRAAALEPAPKPAGGEWVLVPREPTPEMTSKGDCCLPQFSKEEDGDDVANEVYRAMLAATPPAPAALPSGREVKPLAWEAREDIPGLHNALGKDGWWRNIKENSHGRFEYEGDTATTDYNHRQIYSTLSEAKAGAQADYERRIRSALTSPEAPQASEVVRELARQAGDLATTAIRRMRAAHVDCRDLTMDCEKLLLTLAKIGGSDARPTD